MDRIAKIRDFLKQQPDDSFLQHALALELIKLGQDAEAASLFRAILEREPNYIGSYYHLGKLLERLSDTDGAIAVYEKGMAVAKQAGDNHSLSELRGALEDLTF
jgi:tetratricopeptide (TPR) repeat protein